MKKHVSASPVVKSNLVDREVAGNKILVWQPVNTKCPLRHWRVSFIFDDLSPTHGRLPIAPQIDVPKDLSSEMSLEVA